MRLLLSYLILISLVILSCSVSDKAESTIALKNPSPITENDYISAPFQKITNPAFAQEYANKWVRCKANFSTQVNMVIDLPAEYKTNYVRISCGVGTVTSLNILIPKDKSDLVFELTYGDKIELFGHLTPISTHSVLSGAGQSNLLFIVEKLVLLEKGKEVSESELKEVLNALQKEKKN
ncbi:MAG: hypothetical protein HUU50_23435 [Candidatus Brocadiae bacterium]|nr:hypothetical protein [Candidatus Brocadiia bacterium]